MSRRRVRNYLDVYLSMDQLAKLKKGYSIQTAIKGQAISIRSTKDRHAAREIKRLKERIKELEGRR